MHPLPRHGRTVFLLPAAGAGADDHTAATHADLARRLADVLGWAFGGRWDGDGPPPTQPAYFVPADTLPADRAARLGIRDECDLFGGVVPHAFLATKTITHPVVGPDARVPEGWSRGMWRAMGDAVLPGYSAFSPADARIAGERLLARGEVRLKLASGIGGGNQATVADRDQLAEAIGAFDVGDVQRHGVVLELNLAGAVVFSIGRLRVGDWQLAYHGTQRNVRNHRGEEVYGGSELTVVRGGFEALSQLPLSHSQRTAIAFASRYEAAIDQAYPAFFASRRNYDVVAGRDAQGAAHCGVLEQSWRIGGASPAELAALAAFKADPALGRVRASCHEVYGDAPVPAGAIVHYRGDDADASRLCKYSLVEETRGP